MPHHLHGKSYLAIFFTFVFAMFLDALPWPEPIVWLKPDWVALVLIYWVMALPSHFGVFSAWFVGLFVDVLEGSLFGINALSLALAAFLVQLIYHRLRLFPRWKQAINVAVIIGLHRLLVMILTSLVQPVAIDFSYWLPLLGAALFWPWVFILLRDVRRKYC